MPHANAAVKREAGRQSKQERDKEREGKRERERGVERKEARQLVVGVRVLNRSFNCVVATTRFRSAVWAARSWKNNSNSKCSSSSGCSLAACSPAWSTVAVPLRVASYAEVMPAKETISLDKEEQESLERI